VRVVETGGIAGDHHPAVQRPQKAEEAEMVAVREVVAVSPLRPVSVPDEYSPIVPK
jgi:hypothetical protein